MRKISRFGAAALAFALSVTFLTPVSANAMTDVNRNADGSYTKTSKETGKTAKWEKVTDEEGDTNVRQTTGTDDFENTYYTPKKVNVQLKDFTYVYVPLSYGQTDISKIKVTSGKANISIKKDGFSRSTNDRNYVYDYDAKKAYDVDPATGKRSEVAEEYVPTSWATIRLRVYGKKVGKSEIKCTVVDENGKKVATKKITINVLEDNDPLKSVKFAGKNVLIKDVSKATSGYINDGRTFTTKKAGKFKVTMNKNYKLKAIYVQKSLGEEKDDPYTFSDGDSYQDTKYKTTKIDLNGDGDYLDTIDGIDESENSHYSYQKIGNGKKVTLNKVPDSYYYWKSSYNRTNKDQKYVNTEESEYASNKSTTTFIIVYQNKVTKSWGTTRVSITRAISKK